MRRSISWGLLCLFVSVAFVARADVGLLMEQPYGKLGEFSPTGHAAIYLSRVCAETPIRLRRCRPGEYGVVVSRYSRVGGYDWVAVPLLPYLYAVDRPVEIPASVDPQTAARMRDNYRRADLEALAPDGRRGKMPAGEWTELVGTAYRRTIYIFEIQTSVAQDDRLIREFNARPNRRRFNFFFRNCANFAESILNFYFPHAVHRSFGADLGLTTPKQIAKSFAAYGRHQKELKFSTFVIPQVPGTIQRSRKTYGVVEGLVKTKKYAIPLVIWQPYFTAALVGAYFTRGRFDPARNSVVLNRGDELEALLRNADPGSPDRIVRAGTLAVRSADETSGKCVSVTSCGDRAATTTREQAAP